MTKSGPLSLSRRNRLGHDRRGFHPSVEALEERLAPDVSFNLVVPPYSTFGVNNSLVVRYTNTGRSAEPAPVVVLSADDAELWLPTDPAVRGSSLQLLAIAPTGPAGTLSPGATGTIVVNFTSTTQANNAPVNLSLGQLTPGRTINWASLKTDMRPDHIPANAWDAVFANFTANVGTTTDSYQAALGADATYLGQLGERTPNVARLLAYEINKANNAFSTSSLGSIMDASLPTPGVALAFGRWFQPTVAGHYRQGSLGRGWVSNWDVTAATDSAGNVTITAGGVLRGFLRQADGSYQAALGDHGTLTRLANGGYQVTELSGDLTVFNPDGTLSHVQDPNGNRVTATYTSGRLTRLTASNGSFLTLTYTNGLLTAVTDSTGRGTTYTYDAGQHLLSSTNPFGTTRYAYATGQGMPAEHALTSITYADGTSVHYSYDARGRLVGQHRGDGQEALSVAYATGGGFTITDALGSQTSLYHDDLGQLRKVVNPLGETTRFTFNPSGDLTRVNGPLGTEVSYTYDLKGNLVSATDPLGLTTRFTYDAAGRMLSYTDARANTTNYQYDSRGNLLSIQYPNASLEQFQYDPIGNLTRATNARGRAINHTYNAAGQVTETAFADGSKETYTYDSRGNLLTATNATGTMTFRYQDAARPDLITEISYPNGRFLRFEYNAVGQRTKSVDQTGFTINYAYDSVGRLSRLTDGGGGLIVEYNYDAAGRLARKDLGNGTRTTYQYDAAGNLLRLVNLAPDRTTVNSRFDYTYDALGRVTSMTTGGVKTTYGYDAAGQLTAIDTTGLSIRYKYDAAGNRVSETVNGVKKTYTANSMNQYTAVGGTTYRYDADGNLISMTDGSGTTTYTYNDANRLTGVSGPGLSATYTYDPLGHRNGETVNGTTTRFLIDPFGLGDVVSEYTGGGDLVAHYTHGYGLTSRVSSQGAAYYDFDLTGNTAGMTDGAGRYVNRYRYLPFGQTTTLLATLPNRFTFVGEFGVMTDGSGTVNMRFRNYDAATGRFLSNDPLGLAAGDTNLQRYVSNNPVSFNDPSGLAKNPFGPPFGPGNPFKDRGKGGTQGGGGGTGTGSQPPQHVMEEINKGREQGLGKPNHAPTGSEQLPELEIDNARIVHNYLLEGLGLNDQTVSTVETVAGGGFLLIGGVAVAGEAAVGGGVTWLGNALRGAWGAVKAAIATSPVTSMAGALANPVNNGTSRNQSPSQATGAIREGRPVTLRVYTGSIGQPITSARVFFTHTEDSRLDVTATSVNIRRTGGTDQNPTYTIEATVVFRETGRYGITVVVNGNREVVNPHRADVIVYDAPWVVNPVNFTVPVGGIYRGPIATFTDTNPYGNPAYYSAGWVSSATLIPARIEGGGGSYTVIGTVDFRRWTRPGTTQLYVRVWDIGPGPNPKGGADVLARVNVVGSGDLFYSTSVHGQVLNANKDEADPPLLVIDTTARNIVSPSQVRVTVETPTSAATPVPLVTGVSLVRMGAITRIVIEGVASAPQPGAGPTPSAPITVTLPGQPAITARMVVNQSTALYTVNAISVVATRGKPLRNVPVALIEGPANGNYTATINWGDGETSQGQLTALGGGLFQVSGSKPTPYATSGTKLIVVTATGPGEVPASPVQIMATVLDRDPRPLKARLATVRKNGKKVLTVVVSYADTGEFKRRFNSPYQRPKFSNVGVSVRDGDGDGVPELVVVTARRGGKALESVVLG